MARHCGWLARGPSHRTSCRSSLEPPTKLAALGERMLRIAGELTDGTALWMVGPRTLASHIVPIITRAADEACRPGRTHAAHSRRTHRWHGTVDGWPADPRIAHRADHHSSRRRSLPPWANACCA